MTPYEKGDVILVPFPFTDQAGIKKRPAIVISSNPHNSVSRDLILIAVTSQTGKTFRTPEYSIKNWQEAGLLKPSVVKPVIFTIEKRLALKRLGKLSPDDFDSVAEILEELLG